MTFIPLPNWLIVTNDIVSSIMKVIEFGNHMCIKQLFSTVKLFDKAYKKKNLNIAKLSNYQKYTCILWQTSHMWSQRVKQKTNSTGETPTHNSVKKGK